MAKGYTSAAKVAAYLGRTLTTDQQALIINTLLPAVEDWIDGATARAWAATGSGVAEYHRVLGPDLHVSSWPVLAVSTINAYTGSVGEAATALVVGTDYEVRDASRGLIALAESATGYRYVLVTYTYDGGTLPDDLGMAATMIVADWLQPALNVDSYGISEYQVGQELRVKYATGGAVGGRDWQVPQAARDIVERYAAPAGGGVF